MAALNVLDVPNMTLKSPETAASSTKMYDKKYMLAKVVFGNCSNFDDCFVCVFRILIQEIKSILWLSR